MLPEETAPSLDRLRSAYPGLGNQLSIKGLGHLSPDLDRLFRLAMQAKEHPPTLALYVTRFLRLDQMGELQARALFQVLETHGNAGGALTGFSELLYTAAHNGQFTEETARKLSELLLHHRQKGGHVGTFSTIIGNLLVEKKYTPALGENLARLFPTNTRRRRSPEQLANFLSTVIKRPDFAELVRIGLGAEKKGFGGISAIQAAVLSQDLGLFRRGLKKGIILLPNMEKHVASKPAKLQDAALSALKARADELADDEPRTLLDRESMYSLYPDVPLKHFMDAVSFPTDYTKPPLFENFTIENREVIDRIPPGIREFVKKENAYLDSLEAALGETAPSGTSAGPHPAAPVPKSLEEHILDRLRDDAELAGKIRSGNPKEALEGIMELYTDRLPESQQSDPAVLEKMGTASRLFSRFVPKSEGKNVTLEFDSSPSFRDSLTGYTSKDCTKGKPDLFNADGVWNIKVWQHNGKKEHVGNIYAGISEDGRTLYLDTIQMPIPIDHEKMARELPAALLKATRHLGVARVSMANRPKLISNHASVYTAWDRVHQYKPMEEVVLPAHAKGRMQTFGKFHRIIAKA